MDRVRTVIRQNLYFVKKAAAFSKVFVLMSIISTILSGLCPLFLAAIPGYIINCILYWRSLEFAIPPDSRAAEAMSWRQILPLVSIGGASMRSLVLVSGGLLFAYAVIKSVIAAISCLYLRRRQTEFQDGLQLELNVRRASMDMELLDTPAVNDLFQRANDAAARKSGLTILKDTFSLGTDLVTMASAAIVMVRFDAVMAVLLVVLAAASMCINLYDAKTERNFWPRMTGIFRRLNYCTQLLKTPEHAKEIKLYRLSGWISDKYHMMRKKYEGMYQERYGKMAVTVSALSVVENLKQGMVYLLLAMKCLSDQITVGELSSYVLIAACFYEAVRGMMDLIPECVANGEYVEAYRRFMGLRNKIAGDDGGSGEKIGESLKQDFTLELKNVHFRYAGSSKDAVGGMEVSLRKGKFYMVAGENGAGKTTLARLLCRLYDPSGGAILLNGRDIREYDCGEYRKMFSMVFQDFKYYAFSIAENVAVEGYDPGSTAQRERIREALHKSGLWEKVSALPQGIDTPLNRVFDEDGVNLSGGEAQKLALARALYRGGEILILDEPSSALDPKAEDDLISRFKEISEDRLVIYISHRLTCASQQMKSCISVRAGWQRRGRMEI